MNIMKKSILFLIILMVGSFHLWAQENYSTSSKKAIQYFEEAYSQYNLREYEKALEFLDKAISKDDEFIEAYIIKGQVYEGKRNYEKARQNYLKAVGIDPDFYPKLYYSLGLLNLN